MALLAALPVVLSTGLAPASAAPAAVECGGQSVTIVGTAGNDDLRGTSGPDVIHSLAGDDTISGLGGDDLLCGGDGTDELTGGSGDDGLWGGRDGEDPYPEGSIWTGDTLAGGVGDDLLDPGFDDRTTDPRDDAVGDFLTFASAAQGVVVDLAAGTATGDGTDEIAGRFAHLSGSRHDDVLRGTDRREIIVGDRGSDRIDGRGGNDSLEATNGFEPAERTANVILGGKGNDRISGGSGNDDLRGGRGNDDLSGGRGADQIRGGPGGDSIYDDLVRATGQVLDGGPGIWDTLASADIRDARGRRVRNAVGAVDLAGGRLTATFGGKRLSTAATGFENAFSPYGGAWTMFGTDGPNRLSAGVNTSVRIYGRGGNDYLGGSFRSDVLNGGRGFDIAKPLRGPDRLVSIERVR